MNINNPEPDDETNAEQCAAVINPIKDWFLNTWVKGFGAGFTNPTTGWRAYNDEESLIKFWIATELTGDYDGLMSVKAYREADGKLCWGPLWDKDLAFGNYNSMAAADGKLVAHLQQASCIQGYFDKLTQDPEFTEALKTICLKKSTRWRKLFPKQLYRIIKDGVTHSNQEPSGLSVVPTTKHTLPN